ncbi:MAG: HAD hydrolase family protein [Archaeoglobaceae archaeon]
MFFTDWEGPWILTDFAYELCMAVFNNDRFFRNLSEYDDYLAYELKKPEYEAGYTVKLIVPFLAAAGIKNDFVRMLAEKSARFVPRAKEAMELIKKKHTPVVISTSYSIYLETTAALLGLKNYLHGSKIDFDEINLENTLNLLEKIDEIASLRNQELYEKLNELFSIPEMAKILKKLHTIGAAEKAKILEDYCNRFNIDFPVAIGDSISDYKMFEMAKKLGGVAIAFNGNEYAIKNADIAIISENALIEAIVIEKLLENKNLDALKDLRSRELYFVEDCDLSEIIEKSKRMRVKLRGVAGELG